MRNRQLKSVAALLMPGLMALPSGSRAATFARIEAAFEIPGLVSDPFDYEATDVRVRIVRAGGSGGSGPAVVTLPAFFDGGSTWRVRHTPSAPGRYQIEAVTLNGQALSGLRFSPRSWLVGGASKPGFVRLDRRDARFLAFENGARYFPIGHNQAWRSSELPDIPALFAKMGGAGENWSRVWMNHWDNKNLDWPSSGKLGQLNLDVARRWDSIVQAGEQSGIAFQMVFQHHGQYSTTVNPNWNDNPYSAKNGGFLPKPEEFFTDARARALTRRKLRYAVARWGYSPSILAWELWNEVQFTDAARAGQWGPIADWHHQMAAFLRAQDSYRHLITTSSSDSVPAPVWEAMDFYQEHAYPSDLMSAMRSASPRALRSGKPFFVGEFGPSNLRDEAGVFAHAGLWAGLMSGASGAPQYWFWDAVEKGDFYGHFRAASRFVAASGLGSRLPLRQTTPAVATSTRSNLTFGPGGGWGTARQDAFVVEPQGAPEGMGALPSFLQGQAHREMSPRPLSFRVHFVQPGRFVVRLDTIAKSGARVRLSVDGKLTERDFPAGAQDYAPGAGQAELAVEVPAGDHVVTLENTGSDWVSIGSFMLTDYAPALGAYGLSGAGFEAAWLFHRANVLANAGQEAAAASGQVTLADLEPGRYRATWWDTRLGIALPGAQLLRVGASRSLALQSPAISRDVALFVVRQGR